MHTPRTLIRAALTMTVVAATVAACGSGDGDAEPSPGAPAATTTTIGTTAEPTTTAPAPSAAETPATPTTEPAVVAPTPDDLLATAISELGTSYTFESEIIVNGERASFAAGRRVDAGIEVALAQEGTTLTYRSIAGERWIELPDTGWKRLQDDATPLDPLAGLADPTNLSIAEDDGSQQTLLATYAAGVLSLPANGDITVTLTVVDGALRNIDFVGEISARPVELHTAFTPEPGADPVEAPTT